MELHRLSTDADDVESTVVLGCAGVRSYSLTCTRSQYLRSGTLGTSGDSTPHRRSANDDVTDRVCVHPLFRVSGRRQCCVRKTAMEKFGIFYFSETALLFAALMNLLTRVPAS